MPERPVVHALAERLTDLVGGRPLSAVEPLQFSALKTFARPPETITGLAVERVTHRGKYLVFVLDETADGASEGTAEGTAGSDAAAHARVLVHLSQAGRVHVEQPPKRTRPKRGVVRLRFGEADPVALLVIEFGTERKAGWWVLGPGDEGPLADLGPEPDDPAFAGYVREASEDTRWLHRALRDQRTVAGIGRGHADDILHRARLSPFVSLASLDEDERERLLEAIATELDAGLDAERAREGGLPDKLGDHWRVHRRHGEGCPECGCELQRISYEAYEITYCPECQTGGKVLADRRLSRLLK